jgi:hypothetical protein
VAAHQEMQPVHVALVKNTNAVMVEVDLKQK